MNSMDHARHRNMRSYPGKCPGNDMKNKSQPSCLQSQLPLAMAYVPMQKMQNLYEPDKALYCGTIFPELDKPFLGKRGVR